MYNIKFNNINMIERAGEGHWVALSQFNNIFCPEGWSAQRGVAETIIGYREENL